MSRSFVLALLAFAGAACASQFGALRRAEGSPVPAVDAALSNGEPPGKCVTREMDSVLLRRWREEAGIPVEIAFTIGTDGTLSLYEVMTRAVPNQMANNIKSVLTTKCALRPARDADGNPVAIDYLLTIE